jgi:secondary thiamine-phosphate synthase enzyme
MFPRQSPDEDAAMLRQAQEEITIATRGQGLTEFTDEARACLKRSGIATGLLTAYCRHTSASLLIQENADPDVERDLMAFFRRLVPDGDPLYVHTVEGPDDMPAHVKAALTQTSIAIPVSSGKLALGTWQGLFLFEHRDRPHERRVVLHVVGE